jgi:hypothetical protein
MKQLTTEDLNNLIDDKLIDCAAYSNTCQLIKTAEGKKRVVNRVKQIIVQDGITSISAALAQIESELIFE